MAIACHTSPIPRFLLNPTISNTTAKTIIKNETKGTMLSLRTTLLLLGAAALALATPTPGEIKPSQNRPNDPSWYCQWKRRVVYDRYSLEGRGWGVSEGELKKAISKSNGAITGWKYNENDEGGFEAAVSFFFWLFLFSLLGFVGFWVREMKTAVVDVMRCVDVLRFFLLHVDEAVTFIGLLFRFILLCSQRT